MTRRDTPWPAGTPCWVDLMTVDLAASQAFYNDILGWEFTPGIAEFGGYSQATADGIPVAGMSPMMPGMEDAPHAWTVYLATDDLAATDAAAVAAGGQRLSEPMAIGDLGSMGLWLGPGGSAFGAWQSGVHTGFRSYDEPGTVIWCDLMTPAYAESLTFYAATFGYTYAAVDMGGAQYSMVTVPGGERPAAGIGLRSETDPGAPGWSTTFQVADVDAATERVRTASGFVLVEPYDFQFGRMSTVSGRDGEIFSLMTPAPWS